MFKKLARQKVFRDPLYGYIEVEYEIISKLIDSKEVQRLRRIRQLSGVSMVFQTAEHSRFTHALGCYQMANLVLEKVTGAKDTLTIYEQLLFLISALLHDVGHGPYSHAFEEVLETSHEEMTARIIESSMTDINKILLEGGINPFDVASIIRKNSKYKIVEKLVSSELDVDRMDYLTRDAYFTGATYGTIDRNRLLRSLIINKDGVFVRASGVHSVESYLMSRYHMYFQVYYHPVARAYELLLEGIYKRIKDLTDENIKVEANIVEFINVLRDNNRIVDYIALDDAYVNGFVKQLTNSNDHILKTLSQAFLNRKLFKYIDVKDKIDTSNYNKNKYYYNESTVSAVAYLASKGGINMLLEDGSIVKLEDYSPIINSLVDSSYKTLTRIYYFEEEK